MAEPKRVGKVGRILCCETTQGAQGKRGQSRVDDLGARPKPPANARNGEYCPCGEYCADQSHRIPHLDIGIRFRPQNDLGQRRSTAYDHALQRFDVLGPVGVARKVWDKCSHVTAPWKFRNDVDPQTGERWEIEMGECKSTI